MATGSRRSPRSTRVWARIRPPAYAAEAGFPGTEVLPLERDFWRFYRLVP